MNTQLKELFDLFPQEIIENYLTEMKELEMANLAVYHKTSFTREKLEEYLTNRKYQDMKQSLNKSNF